MNIRITTLLLAGIVLLGGCSPRPTVRYLHPSTDTEGRFKYVLTSSVILLAKGDLASNKPGQANQPSPVYTDSSNRCEDLGGTNPNDCLSGVKAVAIPGESPHEMMIEPHEGPFIQTNLSASYVDNTRLLKSIGSQVTDNRLKILQAVGETLTVAAGVGILAFDGGAPPPAPSIKLPVAIDPGETNLDLPSAAWKDLPKNEKFWEYSLTLVHRPADAVPFEKSFAWDTDTHALPVAVCSKVVLRLHRKAEGQHPAGPQVAYPLTVADPAYVETVAFPRQGAIAMHSLCGADITSTPVDTTATWQLLSEAAKEAKAVLDAEQAAKKPKPPAAGGK